LQNRTIASADAQAITRAHWVSTSKLMCMTPTLPSGRAYVEITNNGVDFTNDLIVFEMHAEHKIIGVHPLSGSILGGYEVSLQGSEFQHSSSALCRFGSISTPVAFVSPTNVSCIVPPHQEGVVIVEYSLNGVDFTAHGTPFKYFAVPVAKAVSPARGQTSGGTRVRVQGHNFVSDDVICKFGGIEAAAVEFISDTEIVCISPGLPKEASLSGCTDTKCRAAYSYEVVPS
jgi:hypothetical protein